MIKTYILDTNVLIHNPEALFTFEDNNLVIPLLVIEEIDDHKRRHDEVGRNARVVSRKLDELRKLGKLSEGIELPTGGRLKIDVEHYDMSRLPPGVDRSKADNVLLAVALHLL